jgi:transposase
MEVSMAESRRRHSAEFKREAVRLTYESGRKVSEVAADLGIDRSMLQRWRSAMKTNAAEAFPGKGKRKPSDEEFQRLRRELARVTEEREILKKALTFFAKHPI